MVQLPVVNFINAHFLCKILAPKITMLCFGFEIFWHQNINKKSKRNMLMKSTQGARSRQNKMFALEEYK